jgi:hypothetical protein
MNESINEKVSVITHYDRNSGQVMPKKMRWQGRDYLLTELTYRYKKREGRNIVHVFHVTDGSMDFKLRLNSENLDWTLEEVTDGTPN